MARVEVVMPKMGESVMEGTILTWHKAVGDAVELDETLLEISTDKVDSEVPSPAKGVLAEILVPEGETVEVGTPIAVIETEVDAAVAAGDAGAPPDAEAAAHAAEEEPPAKPAEPSIRPAGTPAPEQEAPAPSAPSGARVEVVMPKMGESVMEGTILTWHKAVGDAVELDETLLEISTDKVDSEVPSPAKGVLAEILVPEGETVEVGTPIAVIATGEGAAAAPSAPAPAPAEATPAPAAKGYGVAQGDGARGDGAPVAAPAQAAEAGPIPRRSESGRFYSPLVRSIAEREGISLAELEQIRGSGAEGRVTKGDVLAYLETRGREATPTPTPSPAPAPAPAPAREAVPAPPREVASRPQPRPAPAPAPTATSDRVEVVEMDRMRQLIAEHMRRSKDTSAHVTSFAEVDVTNLVQLRERQKRAFEQREGVKLTYTPFFVRAAVEALRTHPMLNASVEGTRILIKKDYHIGIAVAIGTKGLLVPIVRDAGQKNLAGLARTIADLAERARNKQLTPDELQGGTFTVTNVGSLGSLMGTPIINQPQVAILSPGKIQKRPVVIEHPELGDVIAVRHMMYVSLSYDHRIIDGAMAASFLQAYTQALEGLRPDEPI